jgi:catechol 2,3-dioxygenase-like lactoylglutathione lyase family enzyme
VKAWRWVTIGVADLESALGFWCQRLGFETSARHDGPDPGLEQHWALPPASIARQALVHAPGLERGMLHLVEYAAARRSVREGAEVFDLCPKNLDIYVDDLPGRLEELRAAGIRFRSEAYSEVTAPDGTRFREIHFPGHDDINFVLLQLLDEPLAFGPSGFSGIGPVVTIVADAAAERAFYRDQLGLDVLHDNTLSGPEIERMIGLPAGAELDVSIWGSGGEHHGQVEIIAYRGTRGSNLYPRAQPGVRGIFQLDYDCRDLQGLQQRLAAGHVPHSATRLDSALLGRWESLSFQTPAGFRLEAIAPE